MRTSVIIIFIISLFCSCSGTYNNKTLVQGHKVDVKNGIVVSAHSEASRIGTTIMVNGGNAIDAAVATEFALAVCYPVAGNIGGGGFMLVRTSDGKSVVIDYREKAPLMSSRNMYLDKNGNIVEGLSTNTHLSAGVPGTVDGMIRVHNLYGRLKFSDVIQPAIDLAENGFKLTREQAVSLNEYRDIFIARNKVKPAFVKDSLWKEGDILIQPELAATLKLIMKNGRNGFYSGKTADLIENEMKNGNGLITGKDLDEYQSQLRKPLMADYRGYKIITVPPPSAGGIILIQILKMIEQFPVGKSGFHSSSSVHLIVEAERRAFADRAEYLGDPDFVKIPLEGLMNKDYLLSRMKNFDSLKASMSGSVPAGNPNFYESLETTHYSVVDAEGNAVSATTTLNGYYGSGIVVEGAGFFLNNEMDDFSSKPGFPNLYGLTGGEANSIVPGKRMLSSMTPTIVEKEGKLFMTAGSPGGSTIPTSVFQVITNLIDFGMDLRTAVDTTRFHHQWLPDYINCEANSLDSLTIASLAGMGHKFDPVKSLGRVNAILLGENGTKTGVGDKRGNNSACGY